jgi:type I restriction enzyme S subunit
MKGWTRLTVDQCIVKVPTTEKIQRKDFLADGRFPIVSQEADYINGYWNDESALFRIQNPVVIFGDHTQVLKYIDFDFVRGADGVKILIHPH